MTTPKPTILIVPGGWHPPSSFAPTTTLLEEAGYTCVGVSLASVGASPPLKDFQPDIDAIRTAITTEISAGHEVLVIFHSYGSVPGGEAVKDLDRTSVQRTGGKGGVVGLVYLSAFAPPKGQSLMDMLGGQNLPWFLVSPDQQTVQPDNPREVFYLDVPETLTAHTLASLRPHSYQTFYSKTTCEPWRALPCTYVYCTDDRAIPLVVQQGMVRATGVEWREETVEGASHSPFLSRPEEVAGMIVRAAGGQ